MEIKEVNKKKTCSIALMSGKGGSGKTTLALSMASMLSSCGVKTLLVDCDISTNGATYFFEEEMAYYVNRLDTLHELLMGEGSRFEDIQLYPVNKSFDFLPSVTKIGNSWTVIGLDEVKKNYLEELFGFISKKYDVVIYDCQAGYTEILETVIRMTDRNLMVLEADSVSASAVRNLFLKLNKVWDNKRIYQVFNKATEEEAEIYNKITSGTIFDNIGCILFDWTVRRAFSISKIPDMIHTSANYGIQVCDLCTALIKNPEISKKLSSYIKTKRLEELKLIEKNLNQEIIEANSAINEKKSLERHEKRMRLMSNMFLLIPPIIIMSIIIIMMITEEKIVNISINPDAKNLIIVLFSVLLSILVAFLTFAFDRSVSFRSDNNKRNITMEEISLKDLNNSLSEVQIDISNLEKSINAINTDV